MPCMPQCKRAGVGNGDYITPMHYCDALLFRFRCIIVPAQRVDHGRRSSVCMECDLNPCTVC